MKASIPILISTIKEDLNNNNNNTSYQQFALPPKTSPKSTATTEPILRTISSPIMAATS